MYYCDSHTHTKYSFDSGADIRKNCEAAIAAGLSELIITDHYECNFEKDGVFEEYEADKAYEEISALKKEYEGRLRVTYGIELGQATQDIDKAEKLLGSYPFEFVIGSLHNLDGVPDFYFLNYRDMPESMIARLWERYLEELEGIVDRVRFSALAHLTYPLRYFAVSGRSFDVSYTYPRIDGIFRKIIEKDIALEVNTSGLRKPIGETSPGMTLVKRYLDLGGKYITVGSDAHRTEDIGAGVKETYARLISAGLENITVFRDGRPELIRIV
ncbi:MAG: histidinol-phosphatase HisJ family protein [Clostridia bacterium]|nr:histidinol-phosphatase HisJ family protein [Clostridia bacterium]